MFRNDVGLHIDLRNEGCGFPWDVTLGLELGHLAAEPIDLHPLRLHPTVPGKGVPGSADQGLHPATEHRLVDVRIARPG